MITLLFAVLILGVVAYIIRAAPIAEFFKVVAYGICAIILLVLLAQALGVNTGISLR